MSFLAIFCPAPFFIVFQSSFSKAPCAENFPCELYSVDPGRQVHRLTGRWLEKKVLAGSLWLKKTPVSYAHTKAANQIKQPKQHSCRKNSRYGRRRTQDSTHVSGNRPVQECKAINYKSNMVSNKTKDSLSCLLENMTEKRQNLYVFILKRDKKEQGKELFAKNR